MYVGGGTGNLRWIFFSPLYLSIFSSPPSPTSLFALWYDFRQKLGTLIFFKKTWKESIDKQECFPFRKNLWFFFLKSWANATVRGKVIFLFSSSAPLARSQFWLGGGGGGPRILLSLFPLLACTSRLEKKNKRRRGRFFCKYIRDARDRFHIATWNC